MSSDGMDLPTEQYTLPSTQEATSLPPSDDFPKSESYSLAAFSKMNIFRKRGQLCDVVIKVGGREFLAHRVVLAATSDYFDAMFSNGMAESAQLEVELKSISPDIMDSLLDYAYTGQVRVTMDNVQDLLPAASLVQMGGVKVACSNFLLTEVDASNVLGIRRFAELHSCTDLEKFARNYAAHNFESVINYDEFVCLNHEELLDLIKREDLHIDCEESVYAAVMRWVHHQVSDHARYLGPLLRNVRLSVLSVRFLTDVVDKDPLIRQLLECRDLVDDAKRFHLRPDLRHEMTESRFRQRDGGNEYLVVIGGFGSDQNPSDSVEMFNPRTMEWSELPDLPVSYRYVAACSLDTCVYVIGGFDGRERLNTVCLLDVAQREDGWRWLTSMHYKRGLSAACTHKGLIYVCGGFDGQSRLRSLEVYHPKIDEWRILEDMNTAREGAGLVVVDETLYCLGGYDGFHLLNSMESFDLCSGIWSICKPMYMRRSGAGCALLGDSIYVCGGYGGAEGRGPLHLDTVEAYNTRLQQWSLVTSMNVPRCYVGACPLAGKIYVAAGYNGSRLLDTVESYDPVDGFWWLYDESRMNHERCDTGMCVVRFLSCAEPPVLLQNTNRTEASTMTSGIASNTAVTQASTTQTPISVVSTGQAMNLRPSLDSSTYRISRLPSGPHPRIGLSGLFRPGLDAHRELTGFDEHTSTSLNDLVGLPTSPVVCSASQRDTLSSRTTQLNPLRRHPNLPVSQPFRDLFGQAPTQIPPGFIPLRDDPTVTRIPSLSHPRSSRQLLTVSSIGRSVGIRWTAGLSFGSTGLPITNAGYSNQMSLPIESSSALGPQLSNITDLELSTDNEATRPSPVSPSRSATRGWDSSVLRTTHLPQTLGAVVSRSSTSSSPTFNRLHYSTSDHDVEQTRAVSLFRSVEALNDMLPNIGLQPNSSHTENPNNLFSMSHSENVPGSSSGDGIPDAFFNFNPNLLPVDALCAHIEGGTHSFADRDQDVFSDASMDDGDSRLPSPIYRDLVSDIGYLPDNTLNNFRTVLLPEADSQQDTPSDLDLFTQDQLTPHGFPFTTSGLQHALNPVSQQPALQALTAAGDRLSFDLLDHPKLHHSRPTLLDRRMTHPVISRDYANQSPVSSSACCCESLEGEIENATPSTSIQPHVDQSQMPVEYSQLLSTESCIPIFDSQQLSDQPNVETMSGSIGHLPASHSTQAPPDSTESNLNSNETEQHSLLAIASPRTAIIQSLIATPRAVSPEELSPNVDSRSDGEGEETENSDMGQRNPAVGQVDDSC